MFKIKDLLIKFNKIFLDKEKEINIIVNFFNINTNFNLNSKDINLKNNILYLNINLIYKNEIFLNKESFLFELNKILGKDYLRDIK